MQNNPYQNSDPGFGEVFQTSFDILRENFSFFMTFSVFYGFFYLIDIFLLSAADQQLVFFNLVGMTVTALFKAVATIAMIYMASQAFLNKKLSLNKTVQRIRDRYWLFITVTILTATVSLGGLFLFILPGIYFLTIFFFAEVFILTEEPDVRTAFQKSANLARFRFWAVLLFSLILEMMPVIPLIMIREIEKINPGLSAGLSVLVMMLIIPYKLTVKVGLFYRFKDLLRDSLDEGAFGA